MKKFYSLLLCALLAMPCAFAQYTLNITPGMFENYLNEHGDEWRSVKDVSIKGYLNSDEFIELPAMYFESMKRLDLSQFSNNILKLDLIVYEDTTDPDQLEVVVLSDHVTEILGREYWGAFSYTGLKYIDIPRSVTKIGKAAFEGCSKLKQVYIKDLTSWCNINFEDANSNPLVNGAFLFINNEPVDSLVIPESVTSLKPYQFCGGNFSIVTIPQSVYLIDKNVFGCKSDNDSYYDVNSIIKNIYVYSTTPPVLNGAFEGINLDKVILHVPRIACEAYKDAKGWKNFKHIEPIQRRTEVDAELINNAIDNFF